MKTAEIPVYENIALSVQKMDIHYDA